MYVSMYRMKSVCMCLYYVYNEVSETLESLISQWLGSSDAGIRFKALGFSRARKARL